MFRLTLASRRMRYSLRSLFVLVAILCVALGWNSYCMNQWAKQRLAKANLEEADWRVFRKYRVFEDATDEVPWFVENWTLPALAMLDIYAFSTLPRELLPDVEILKNAQDLSLIGPVDDDVLQRLIGADTEALQLFETDLSSQGLEALTQSRGFSRIDIRGTIRPEAAGTTLPNLPNAVLQFLARDEATLFLNCSVRADDLLRLPKRSFSNASVLEFYIADTTGNRQVVPTWLERPSRLSALGLSGPGCGCVLRQFSQIQLNVANLMIGGSAAVADIGETEIELRDMQFLASSELMNGLTLEKCKFNSCTLEYILQHAPRTLRFDSCTIPGVDRLRDASVALERVVFSDCEGDIEGLQTLMADRDIAVSVK